MYICRNRRVIDITLAHVLRTAMELNSTNFTVAVRDNTTMLHAEEGFSPLMRLIFICYYSLIFFLASLGNTLALLTCYKTYKTSRTSVLLFGYIACLAAADLLFTVLSTFDFTYFLVGHWVGGNAVCKIQSFLIETCYTVSILTLVAISYERLKAVTTPIQARSHRVQERKLIPKLVWCVGTAACVPLLYAYTVEEEDGNVLCVNTIWGDEARQIYYGIQAVLLFLVPLAIMIWAHVKIFRSLSQHITTRNKVLRTSAAQDRIKQRKVTKMLALVTLLFAVCYIPFIVIRTLRYLYLYSGEEVWKLVQLLIFTQAAFNPIIYCLFSNQFRLSYKDLLRCRFTVVKPGARKATSSSAGSTSSLRLEKLTTNAPLNKTLVKVTQSPKSAPKPIEL